MENNSTFVRCTNNFYVEFVNNEIIIYRLTAHKYESGIDEFIKFEY